jgi:hypothetical protein
MPTNSERLDSEPFRPEGKPLPYDELLAISEIKPQDVDAAVDFAEEAFPPRYRGLLG